MPYLVIEPYAGESLETCIRQAKQIMMGRLGANLSVRINFNGVAVDVHGLLDNEGDLMDEYHKHHQEKYRAH